MVEITETFFAPDREAWRKWLNEHHSTKKEIWLIIHKKHVKEPSVSYEEAVEEALCFGWIDGIMKRIDDRMHTIRFSPRKINSYWAGSNIERVERLIENGLMEQPGLEIFNARDRSKEAPSVKYMGNEVEVPDLLADILKENPGIWEKFIDLPPSHKNQYIGWVMTAKKEETRLRRAHRTAAIIGEGR